MARDHDLASGSHAFAAGSVGDANAPGDLPAAGADALFLEVHPRPLEAPSDSTNMLQLDRLEGLLKQALALRGVVHE